MKDIPMWRRYMLFPKLRATADLLMMPKEVLTDRTIRSEVIPGLPLRLICELLSRFEPDELASEPLPPGLLEALQNETPPSEDSPSPISQGLADYEAPSEAALLADGLIEPVRCLPAAAAGGGAFASESRVGGLFSAVG